MRDLFFKLFETSHFNTGIKIEPFNFAHIIYLLIIFGSIVGGYFLLRKESEQYKEKIMRVLVWVLLVSYVSDFFVHEFVYGGLNMDKLPFHICTVLCPLAVILQNCKNKRIKEPVVVLAILAPLMYLCYPASVGSGEPWCYQAVQTMFYHGLLLAWGVLNIALGLVRPHLKNSWTTAVLLVCITLWAKLGNTLYRNSDGEEFNWFFLEEDAFYIGLVENGVIPQWLLMIINPVVFFAAALVVYGISHAINNKRGFDDSQSIQPAQKEYICH